MSKFNLLDTTFTIPVKIESEDRHRNLKIIIAYLQKYFYTNILIGESSPEPTVKNECKKCGYIFFKNDNSHLHRTKILNNLCRASSTTFIVNYDTDVLLSPSNIIESVRLLREGKDVVYPYSGMFRNISSEKIPHIQKNLNIDHINNNNTTEMSPDSYGGSIFWNKQSFMKIGMENENFISWGLEDNERITRAKKLGLTVYRVPGTLYHLDHWRGEHSYYDHEFYKNNAHELLRISTMSKEKLEEYIKTWSWL